MNQDQITRAKFQACMQNTASKYDTFELYTTKKSHDYNYQEFNRIMIRGDLDEYSKLLFDYFNNILEINRLNRDAAVSYNMNSEEYAKYRLELLKIIRFLTNNSKDLTRSFTISKAGNKYIVGNEKLVCDLEDFLFNYFSNNFKEMLSDEEADQELKNPMNKVWLSKWINEYKIQGVGNVDLPYSDIDESKPYVLALTNEHLSGSELKKSIIRSFKLTHPKKTALTVDNLELLIRKYEMQLKGKLGAPPKILAMSNYLLELADLIRINKFLKTPAIDNMDSIRMKSTDLKTIYLILDFWGLIPPREDNSTTPEKYLRSTLRQTKKFLPPDFDTKRNKRFMELKRQIDLF